MLKKIAISLLLGLILTTSANTNVSFKTNHQIKVYMDNKLINSDFYLKRKVRAGSHRIKICTKNNKILDQRNIYIANNEHLIYNHIYQSKNDLTIKSMILPSLGQFYNKRYISGGIIAGATLGSVSYIMLQYGKFIYNDKEYDKALNSHIPNYLKANDCRKKCIDAITQIKIGTGTLGLIYLYNIADSYFFSKEHRLKITKSNSKFEITPAITLINKNTAIGFTINF